MTINTVTELASVLGRLRLVSDDELQRLSEVAEFETVESVLESLERRHVLTDFQIRRIRDGELEGLVLGDYKLMYRNAAGSFARVFRACSISTGEMIGLKVLRKRWIDDPQTVQLFHREGELGKRLKHRNIVPIYDVATQGTFHYLTMEFIEGGNLRDFLKIRGKLQPLETARYAMHMAQALEYALGLGVTHRDLKMTNVLMSNQGIAKLIDFGLATHEGLLGGPNATEFQTALESTIERHTGAPLNDPRSDLFFLGGILYELLTGIPPYERTRDRDERKRFSRYSMIRPITDVNRQLPECMTEVVTRLLEIEPANRYQSPGELVRDLRAALAKLGDTTVALSNAGDRQVVMCVEDRPKHQDMLREYLSKHGYRPLMLRDPNRAVDRTKETPPDCLLLMGESIGDTVVNHAIRAADLSRDSNMKVLVILSEKQQSIAARLQENERLKVILQPITLRAVREIIDTLVKSSE